MDKTNDADIQRINDSGRRPVVFIPGLWLHHTSWNAWAALFEERGYTALVRGWPGASATVAEARENPKAAAGYGIDDMVNHYAAWIRQLKRKPVVVGHSFGGLFAQKLLGLDLAAAAVAIDPAQPKGVWPLPAEQLKSGFPVLGNPFLLGKAVALTDAQFRFAFTNALSEEEHRDLYDRWSIPSPTNPLFSAAVANLVPGSQAAVQRKNPRGPLLLVTGGQDHTVPSVVTRANLALYRKTPAVTELLELADRGHSLTIDHGWRDLAEQSLAWLDAQKL